MRRRLKLCAHLFIAAAVIAFYLSVEVPAIRRSSLRSQCNSSLGCIDLSLGSYCYPPVNNYPPSLADLSHTTVTPLTFACPWARTEPQSLDNLDAWSDRMYLAGLNPATPPGVPVVVCPPINHDGRGGNVLFSEHTRRWIPSPKIDAVIDHMYAYAASNGLRVVVSEALTKRSKGRYASRPSLSLE